MTVSNELRDPPPDPAWFLIGCLSLFPVQLAVYAGLIVQCARHYLERT